MSVTWNSSKQSSHASIGQPIGQRRHRVVDVAAALLREFGGPALSPVVQAVVNLAHELVEMHPALCAPPERP